MCLQTHTGLEGTDDNNNIICTHLVPTQEGLCVYLYLPLVLVLDNLYYPYLILLINTIRRKKSRERHEGEREERFILLKSMYSLYALTLAFGDSITTLVSVILYKKKSIIVC